MVKKHFKQEKVRSPSKQIQVSSLLTFCGMWSSAGSPVCGSAVQNFHCDGPILVLLSEAAWHSGPHKTQHHRPCWEGGGLAGICEELNISAEVVVSISETKCEKLKSSTCSHRFPVSQSAQPVSTSFHALIRKQCHCANSGPQTPPLELFCL